MSAYSAKAHASESGAIDRYAPIAGMRDHDHASSSFAHIKDEEGPEEEVR
jgi:hypothetical protein